MRWFLVGLLLFVIVGVTYGGASVNEAVVAGPKLVESIVQQAATDEALVDAHGFAEACAQRASAQGFSGTWVVTMSSSAKSSPDDEGVQRLVTARFEGTQRLPFGMSRKLAKTISTNGVLANRVIHDASHWPDSVDPLPLEGLLPGQRGPSQFIISETNWTTSSRDGAVTLFNTEVSGGCEVRCEGKDGAIRWSEKGPCVIPKAHLRFVSDDCERVVTIDPKPITARLWQTLPVARVFARSTLAYEVAAGTLVTDGEAVKRKRGWLRGLSDVTGEGPVYGEDGKAVVLVTADGNRHELPLVALAAPDASVKTK